MNIYEISEEHSISVTKLRKLERDGLLCVDGQESQTAAALRYHLRRNQIMTVAQVLQLIDAPGLVIELNRWAERARTQLEALGDVKATQAPRDVTAYIDDAARGDAEAIAILLRWLQIVLPTRPVPHAWVGVRLLVGLPENLRAYNIRRVPLALLNVRKQPEFAGWWHLASTGGTERNRTFYARPKIIFDL